MEISIKENTEMVNLMVKESILGLMAHVTKGSLLREFERVKVVGNQPKTTEIFILEPIRLIKRMDTVVMFGQTDAFLREALPMT